MSTDDTGSVTDIDNAVDKRTDKAQTEVHEAVTAIMETVDAAANAGDEAMDVAMETRSVLKNLSTGKRMAAAQSAIDLLDDDTRKEANEALSAVRDVLHEADSAFAELVDVADVLTDAAVDISSGILSLDLPVDDLNDFGDLITGRVEEGKKQ